MAAVYLLLMLSILLAIHSTSAHQTTWQVYLAEHDQELHEDLKQLVAIPSVSALPEHQPDIKAAAGWLSRKLLKAGMQYAAVLDTGGPHPIVYGHWFAHTHNKAVNSSTQSEDPAQAATDAAAAGHEHSPPGTPTVIIYGHYDVQPVDPLDRWHSPPFEVTLKDGYLYGRGVDDDKGGVLQAIHAVEALIATRAPDLPINIKFFLEGQEEVMSPDLTLFLEKHAAGPLLRSDAVLSADGQEGGISLGLRGVVGMELEVVTAGTDMHSGFTGGSVANPCSVLAGLLAGLHDAETGKVTVAGFYEGVPPITEVQRADAAGQDWDGDAEAASLGLKGWWGDPDFTVLERRWYRPTLEIVGMTCGFTGAGIKTVIPRAAVAKISCRLVGDQQPSDVLAKVAAHLKSKTPSYANISVKQLGGSTVPWNGKRDSAINRVAAHVWERLRGKKPLFRRDGATIPALAAMQAHLGVDIAKWGWGTGEGVHAPNERIKVSQWEFGRCAWAEILLEITSDGTALITPEPSAAVVHTEL